MSQVAERRTKSTDQDLTAGFESLDHETRVDRLHARADPHAGLGDRVAWLQHWLSLQRRQERF